MAWPQAQDYNEAIQDPQSCFGDPELRGGQPVTNAMGLPMPRSGNFADVYEFVGASGSKWAVKCFTREVSGLQETYQAISKQLEQAKLPFMVDFQYLPMGIRIRGQCYPVLKMHWVEGLLLNEFVRANLDKPARLEGLGQIWLRMAQRLGEAGIAHADLQHGNVILVPGRTATSLAVKLIDYDGMFVPALTGKKSGEVGHPNFQHPQRLRSGIYNAQVDRFPHLVIYTSLRSLIVGGPDFWKRYDNGDNLLFKEADLAAPAQSPLFRELAALNDAEVKKLVQTLAEAVQKPLEQTPLLEELASAGRGAPPAQKSQVAPPATQVTAAPPEPLAAFAGFEAEDRLLSKRKGAAAAAPPSIAKEGLFLSKRMLYGIAAAGAGLILLVVLLLVLGRGGSRPVPDKELVAQKANNKANKVGVPIDNPRPNPGKKDPRDNLPPLVHNPPPVIVPPAPIQEQLIVPEPAPIASQVPVVRNSRIFQKNGTGPLAVTPDGKQIVHAVSSVWVANTETGVTRRIGKASSGGSILHGLVISPDGKVVYAGLSGDTFVQIFDLETGQSLGKLEDAPGVVGRIAISGDGKRLLVASTGHRREGNQFVQVPPALRLYDLATQQRISEFPPKDVSGIALYADGHRALIQANRTVEQWDLDQMVIRKTLNISRNTSGSLSLSDDGRWVAVGTGKSILLLDGESLQPIKTLAGHDTNIVGLTISSDNHHLLSWAGSVKIIPGAKSGQPFDANARLWDMATGKLVCVLEGNGALISQAVLHGPTRQVYAGNFHDIRQWDLNNVLAGAPPAVVAQPAPKNDPLVLKNVEPNAERGIVLEPTRVLQSGSIGAVAVTPDGTQLVTTTGACFAIDLASGKQRTITKNQGGAISHALAISPDGKLVYTSLSSDTVVRIVDLATGQELGTLEENQSMVGNAALSADGKRLLTATSGSRSTPEKPMIVAPAVRLYDTATKQLLWETQPKTSIAAVSLYPRGERALIRLYGTSQLEQWDLDKKELRKALRIGTGSALALSADGSLAAANAAKDIVLLNAEDLSILQTLRGHDTPIRGILITPDNRYIISWAGFLRPNPVTKKTEAVDGDIRVLDATTGKVVASLTDGAGIHVFGAAFHGPSHQVFATAVGGIRQWDLSVLPWK